MKYKINIHSLYLCSHFDLHQDEGYRSSGILFRNGVVVQLSDIFLSYEVQQERGNKGEEATNGAQCNGHAGATDLHALLHEYGLCRYARQAGGQRE